MPDGSQGFSATHSQSGAGLVLTRRRFNWGGLLGYVARKVVWWPVASVVWVSGL